MLVARTTSLVWYKHSQKKNLVQPYRLVSDDAELHHIIIGNDGMARFELLGHRPALKN